MRLTNSNAHQGLKRFVIMLCAICCLATIIWGAQSASPADVLPGSEKQTLRALLDEVRQLRLALQRTSSTTTRAQLAFERMRLQRGRLDALLREVESVRSQILSLRDAMAQASERVKEMEELTGQTSETALRARFERQLNMAKQVLNSHTRREEQLRERETQLTAQLQTEQVKLTELEDQLVNLERELSAP